MDLLLAVVVWSLGAWLAYRLTRRTAADKEPRRRQEGMDVRRRRGQGPAYRPVHPNVETRRDFFRRVPSSADRPRPGPSGR